jgi:hypothetical protein
MRLRARPWSSSGDSAHLKQYAVEMRYQSSKVTGGRNVQIEKRYRHPSASKCNQV